MSLVTIVLTLLMVLAFGSVFFGGPDRGGTGPYGIGLGGVLLVVLIVLLVRGGGL